MALTYLTLTLFFMAIGAFASCAVYIGHKLDKISLKFELYVKLADCKERRQSCVCSSAMNETLKKLCEKFLQSR